MYIVPKEKHQVAVNGIVLGEATQEQLKALAAKNHPYVTQVDDKPKKAEKAEKAAKKD